MLPSNDQFPRFSFFSQILLDHVFPKMDLNDLVKLDKEQLIQKIASMHNHINQLKNVIQKFQPHTSHRTSSISSEKFGQQQQKQFDFSRYQKRHIFLKFLYLGWNYDGLVVQEDSNNTIEKIIFDALIKTKLVENRETCNYHRCGRTDKGVSAFCQVISLDVRSKMKHGIDMIIPDNRPHEEELDYVSLLNKVLPKDVRVYAWAPVLKSTISARFDCAERSYRYFFPRMDLDIQKMNEACQSLIGVHDFRNLCKMDVNNGVVNYVRRVHDSSVRIIQDDGDSGPYSMCVFSIEATAFLWHQIRYIMSVLFLVGQHLESPSIFDELLDIEVYPRKPQYPMAADLPLVLYDAQYEPELNWIHGNIGTIIGDMNSEWASKAIQCTMIKSMIDSLSALQTKEQQQKDFSLAKRQICGDHSFKQYKKLFDRPTCDSLEEQIEKSEKKRIKIQ